MAGPGAPAAPPPLRKKMVYSIDTPFSSVEWPEISTDDQDAILELLCSFLAPIGHHRRSLPSSQGKRAKKRKRASEKQDTAMKDAEPTPPAPEQLSSVDVGLSAITRRLQDLSSQGASTKPKTEPTYSVIFVARSGQSSAFNGHFPQMVAVASNAVPDAPPIRLVGYSKACGERLSASLGIPRVSSIGIRRGASGSAALINFVQKCVAPIRVSWLEEAGRAEYRASQVVAEEKMVAAVVKTVKT